MGLTGWLPVVAKPGPTPSELVVDLTMVPAGAAVSAIRYAAGSGGYNRTTGRPLARELGSNRICCGPKVDTALEPCEPERCPIKTSGTSASDGVVGGDAKNGLGLQLPAPPFFASISRAGKCRCFLPQVCDS